MFVVGDSGFGGNVGESAVLVVAKKNAGRGIAGDVEIGPAVFVQISGYGGKGVEIPYRADAGLLADVFESSVPAIVIEGCLSKRHAAGTAEDRHSFPFAIRSRAGQRRARQVECLVAGDEQVETAVAIVVEKRAAGTPFLAGPAHSGAAGDILKCALAVVPVQNVRAPVGHIKIIEAVVIEIRDADAAAPAGALQAGRSGHILEFSRARI